MGQMDVGFMHRFVVTQLRSMRLACTPVPGPSKYMKKWILKIE